MKIVLIFIFLFTISCTTNKVVNNHGLTALELKSKKIITSTSNKNDVINIIGKPSSTSLFNENTWFYMQRELENKSFLTLGKQKITTNNVLEINFNDYGIVVSKKIYSLKDMNEVKIDKDKTENMAIKKTGINSLFQSIYQKINAPKNNRKRN